MIYPIIFLLTGRHSLYNKIDKILDLDLLFYDY